MTQTAQTTKDRPLSPHLQIYRPQMTSVLSILHRMTGAGLSVGLFMFAWWLIAAAYGPQAYAVFTDFISAWYGQVLLFGWSAAAYYHMANGIRHLIWDAGYLFKIKNAYTAGYFVLLFTVLATAGTWACIYSS